MDVVSAPQSAPVFNLAERAPWRTGAFPNSLNEFPELGSDCLGCGNGGPRGLAQRRPTALCSRL